MTFANLVLVKLGLGVLPVGETSRDESRIGTGRPRRLCICTKANETKSYVPCLTIVEPRPKISMHPGSCEPEPFSFQTLSLESRDFLAGEHVQEQLRWQTKILPSVCMDAHRSERSEFLRELAR